MPASATGEVAGTLLELLDGRRAQIVVVAATREYAGALEDVASAMRRLLCPVTLLSAGVAGLRAAGLDAPPPGAPPPGAAVPGPPGRPEGGLAALAVEGAPEQAGAKTALRVWGLSPLGAPVQVTSGTGALVGELAGRPALEVVTALARQHLPAGRLAGVGRRLVLAPADWSPGPAWDAPGVAVVGVDRASGAIALAGEMPGGGWVRVLARDDSAGPAELAPAVAAATAAVVSWSPAAAWAAGGGLPGAVLEVRAAGPFPSVSDCGCLPLGSACCWVG